MYSILSYMHLYIAILIFEIKFNYWSVQILPSNSSIFLPSPKHQFDIKSIKVVSNTFINESHQKITRYIPLGLGDRYSNPT